MYTYEIVYAVSEHSLSSSNTVAKTIVANSYKEAYVWAEGYLDTVKQSSRHPVRIAKIIEGSKVHEVA